MWKMERAWPFFLLTGFYILIFRLIPWLGDFILTSPSFSIPDGKLEVYYNVGSWIFGAIGFWTALFYLKRNRFEGDQFKPILILLAIHLFIYKAVIAFIKLEISTPLEGVLPMLYHLAAFGLAYYYWKRHHRKIKKARYDLKKLRLVITFVVVSALISFLWTENIFSYNIRNILNKIPNIIVLNFFFIHLKHLQLKEDGEDQYEKLIDDFGKNVGR